MAEIYIGTSHISELFAGDSEIYEANGKLYFRGHILDELWQGDKRIYPLDVVHIGSSKDA